MTLRSPSPLPVVSGLCLLALALVAAPVAAQSPPAGPFPGTPLPVAAPAPGMPELPPPSDPTHAAPSSWEIELSLAGSTYALQPPTPNVAFASSASFHGNRASGGVEVTRYLGPVVDDGAPRSLQPFLQRTSLLYATLLGGGFETRNPDGFTPSRTDANLSLEVGADIYLSPYVALTAAVIYGYDVLHDVGIDQKQNIFGGSLGLGFRYHDVRFDVTSGFTAFDVDGSFSPVRWTGLKGNVYGVISRSVALTGWVGPVPDGVAGGAEVGWYATPDFGIFLSGYGERGEIFSNSVVASRLGGKAGPSFWVSPTVRFAAYYTLTYTDVTEQVVDGQTNGYTELDHQLSLYGVLRLP
jgi:hypothetical protein